MTRRFSLFRFAVLLMILALPLAAFAGNAVGRPSGGGSSIEFIPNITGHEKIVLTVSNGDDVWTKEFSAGKNVSFRLSDLGTEVANGVYQYEMRVVPKVSADVAKKLERARAAGDEKAAKKIMKDAGLADTLVQSGAFTIANGSIVSPDAIEEGAGNASSLRSDVSTNLSRPGGKVSVNDQVIPDDLIVQGSACVGLDCVNNESFGFDTIRLKENNTRIKFEDTSVGSFPTNDWQLTANDSASGAASKFSIEDITGARVPFTITAGAATNTFFADSTGRIGLRTSTPVLDLHINTSNTPAIRLEQNNSGGFTAQTWDVAGNEANFFVRDVTGGSKLPFRIRPGAPTSSVDISSDGDVGIGTASPAQALHILRNADANIITLTENTSSSGLSANAAFQTKADVAVLSFQSHGSARTISRFGKVLGSWNEMLSSAGNGLLIGTLGSNDLILGTNSTARMTIAGTGAITVPGNFTVTGTKNFAVIDPADPSQALYYTALEGPEAGTYFRGTAKTVKGVVTIELPAYFANLTETQRMTVQLTPVGAPGQLYVAEKSPEKLVIKVADGSADLEFDYLVQGVRKGYLNYEVERKGAFPVVKK